MKHLGIYKVVLGIFCFEITARDRMLIRGKYLQKITHQMKKAQAIYTFFFFFFLRLLGKKKMFQGTSCFMNDGCIIFIFTSTFKSMNKLFEIRNLSIKMISEFIVFQQNVGRMAKSGYTLIFIYSYICNVYPF